MACQFDFIENCIESIPPPPKIYDDSIDSENQGHFKVPMLQTEQEKLAEFQSQFQSQGEKVNKTKKKRVAWEDSETRNLYTVLLLFKDVESLMKKERNINLKKYSGCIKPTPSISSHLQTEIQKCLKLYDLLKSVKESVQKNQFINPGIYVKTLQFLAEITPMISSIHLKKYQYSQFKDIHLTAINLLHFFTQPCFKGDKLMDRQQILQNIGKLLNSLSGILCSYREDMLHKKGKDYKNPVEEQMIIYRDQLKLQFEDTDIVLDEKLRFEVTQHYKSLKRPNIVHQITKPNQFQEIIIKSEKKMKELAKIQIKKTEETLQHMMELQIQSNPAFRKQALKWHPDKNPSPEATEIFQEINQAYNVLTDPQERKWYDDHRESILSGGKINQANYLTGDDLFKYFSASTFKNKYTDVEGGFYKTFDKLFKLLDEQEDAAIFAKTKDQDSDQSSDDEPHVKYPEFGHSHSSYEDVKMFYDQWCHFYTRKKFSFMDKYNPNEGPNRKIKRLIIQQNLKERARERKEFNQAVHKLVDWLKKRDPRWIEFKRLKAEEEKKREEELKFKKEAEKLAKKQQRKIAMAEMVNRLDIAEEERLIKQYEEQLATQKLRKKAKKAAKRGAEDWNPQQDDWKSSKKQKDGSIKKNKKRWKEAQKEAEQIQKQLQADDDEDDQEKQEEKKEEEPEQFLCEVCEKFFKSKEQLKNHFDSKKHKKIVKEVMKELKVSKEQLKESKVILTPQKARTDPQPQEDEVPKISKKKLKKKQKKWNGLQTKAEESEQEEKEIDSQEEEEENGKQEEEEDDKQKQEVVENEQAQQNDQQDEEEEEQKQECGLLKMPGEQQQAPDSAEVVNEQSFKKIRKGKKVKGDEPQSVKNPNQQEEVPFQALSKKQKRKLKQKAMESTADWVCNVCAKEFETRNSLFKHLKEKKHQRADGNQPILATNKPKSKKKGKSMKDPESADQ